MRTGEKMEDKSYIERLMEFGLTRQEAGIYGCLISEGKTTGYEVAKQLGISRSNAYNSLASMTEKGAAYLVEEGIASPEDIDRTIKYGNGLRYVCSGPFQIAVPKMAKEAYAI